MHLVFSIGGQMNEIIKTHPEVEVARNATLSHNSSRIKKSSKIRNRLKQTLM